MNKYIYQKGTSIIQVNEINDMGMIQGMRGLIDIIDLMRLLQSNGYRLIK